jgi:hypothetical protein
MNIALFVARDSPDTRWQTGCWLFRPDVPIVIISGLVDAPEGMEHADLFICKGNSPTEFLQKISDLLNSRS